ncbi:MAG: hypothetical protein KDE20_16520 [Caldilineaceae bacterium]|nr:hypothetical protein [Caldilineaceae bacterium]
MSADQMPTRKMTKPQAQLLAYMQAGAVPTLRMGIPGETVHLGPWEQNWRKTHDGQPVDPRTVNGLVSQGLVIMETKRRGLFVQRKWVLA